MEKFAGVVGVSQESDSGSRHKSKAPRRDTADCHYTCTYTCIITLSVTSTRYWGWKYLTIS